MKWKGKLINYIIEQLKNEEQWEDVLGNLLIDNSIGIHLAIFNEPFLSLLFDGKKTIESRFSVNKICPFGRIRKGDLVLVKESGGFICGIFKAGNIRFYPNLNNKSKEEIEREYGDKIATSSDVLFWERNSDAKYATLIEVANLKKTKPFKCIKSDRQGWAIVREGIPDSLFHQKVIKLKSIITVSGRIGSGKSYVAKEIQNKYSLPVASFGSFLRECCALNNLPIERETLQEIGELLVKVAPEQFLTEVISRFVDKETELVLDGVRHQTILEHVKMFAESHISIFVNADPKIRYERVLSRNRDSDQLRSYEQFISMDNHPVEREVESLRNYCDLVLDSTNDYSSELFSFIERKRGGS